MDSYYKSSGQSSLPLRPGFWRCPKCGAENASYVFSCGCGLSKCDVSSFSPEAKSTPQVTSTYVIPVINYSPDCVLQASEILINKKSGLIRISFVNYNTDEIPKAVRADIELVSIFDDSVVSKAGVSFFSFKSADNGLLNTEFVTIDLSVNLIKEVVGAKVKLTNIVFESKKIKVTDNYEDSELSLDRLNARGDNEKDVVCEAESSSDGWRCSCGMVNAGSSKSCRRCARTHPSIISENDYRAKLLSSEDFFEFKRLLNEQIDLGNKDCEEILNEIWTMRVDFTFDEMLSAGKEKVKRLILNEKK